MKVYCKNCKYDFFDKNICYYTFSGGNEYSGYYKEHVNFVKESKNGKGDCRYYKKKWWRFWVKN